MVGTTVPIPAGAAVGQPVTIHLSSDSEEEHEGGAQALQRSPQPLRRTILPESGRSIWFGAARSGNIDTLRAAIERGTVKGGIDARGDYHKTAYARAPEAAKPLIMRPCLPVSPWRDFLGQRLTFALACRNSFRLYLAVEHRHPEAVQLLLEANADPSPVDRGLNKCVYTWAVPCRCARVPAADMLGLCSSTCACAWPVTRPCTSPHTEAASTSAGCSSRPGRARS